MIPILCCMPNNIQNSPPWSYTDQKHKEFTSAMWSAAILHFWITSVVKERREREMKTWYASSDPNITGQEWKRALYKKQKSSRYWKQWKQERRWTEQWQNDFKEKLKKKTPKKSLTCTEKASSDQRKTLKREAQCTWSTEETPWSTDTQGWDEMGWSPCESQPRSWTAMEPG